MDIRRIAYGSPEHAEMLALRARILREPFGQELTEEEALKDKDALCLLGCYDGDALAGCLLLDKLDDGWCQMRQVAVCDGRQGKGIGGALLQASYKVLRELGHSRLFCDARCTAEPFYLKHGWRVTSDVYEKNALPHRRMEAPDLARAVA